MIGLLASIKSGVSTLASRLTATRAGYLDNLSTVLTNATWTDQKAGFIDTAITSRLGSIKAIYRGTISVTTSGNEGSNTATITAVTTSKAVVSLLGFTVSGGSGGAARVELTNSTTVTATASSATSSNTVVVAYQVVEHN